MHELCEVLGASSLRPNRDGIASKRQENLLGTKFFASLTGQRVALDSRFRHHVLGDAKM